MKAVIQRVKSARVTVGCEVISRIDRGAVALVGIETGDTENSADLLARKISGLRYFQDDNGKMNLSISDISGEMLMISQFTLLGDCRKGRRPSFVRALSGPDAQILFDKLCDLLSLHGIPIKKGAFGEHMEVELINDGPVTLLLDV